MRRCNNCSQDKEDEDFYLRNGKISTPCKECKIARARKHKEAAKAKGPVVKEWTGTRDCKTCGETKDVSEYYTYKINGNLYGDCKTCVAAKNSDWYQNNTDVVYEATRAWRDANPDKVAAAKAKWVQNNPEKRKEVARNYYYRNSETMNKTSMEWKEANPHKAAFSRAKSRYGMTQELWDSLPDFCEICFTDKGRMNIDHDHDTGLIRGKLCTSCNTALAFFDEGSKSFAGKKDPELVSNARGYMRRHYGAESGF